MINERWPLRPLGELFEIGAGKTMSAAARNGHTKVPFLRTSNVYWDEIDLSAVDRMAIPPHELEAKLLRPGDLLVCEGGDIGRAAVWNGEVEVMSFQNHLHRLRPLVDDVDPRFYVYFLQSGFTQLGIFEGTGNRTTIPNLSRNRLASLEVPHPDLEDQRAVVRALARVREGIGAHNQAHEVAQVLKRATMRRLFTRGLQDEPQKETEIGPVPESWELSSLGELCSRNGGRIQTGPFGSQLHANEYKGEGTPVINPTHLEGNRISHIQAPRISDLTSERLERHKVEAGDILFARRGEIGRHGLVAKAEAGWICGTGSFLVRVRHPAVSNTFLSYLFSTPAIVGWLEAHATGTIMPNLNGMLLSALPVAYPDLQAQKAIVEIVSSIDRKIDLHRRKRAAFDDLFKALLHKLMTGEIQATDLDLSALTPNGSEPAAA